MKYFLLFILMIGLFSSCEKDSASCKYDNSPLVATASEIAYLSAYMQANSINATQDASGVFYVIHAQGSGKTPNICSPITVNYKLYLLSNGTLVDESLDGYPYTNQLGALIVGWQKVLPVIKPGGSITLYIPPSLAYGSNNQNPAIPPNSYLRFEIELLSVG
ncbi:MAG: FKBP-type peptidyl-prolyl cis-trans isomerase [Niastella sp.]|nr:FKBP-type peptidyl-prolyl cis-trans isomerase [Niastella sp.]